MKRILAACLCLATWVTLLGLAGCRPSPSDYCVVKGTIKGVDDGAPLELQDFWNRCRVVGTAVVKDGAFEFHPKVSAPTHVFLYQDDQQLQDFYLEPGIVFVEVDAAEGDGYGAGATGTPSNDVLYRYRTLLENGEDDAVKALVDSVMTAQQTGPLAVTFADGDYKPAISALNALERLTPEVAGNPFVASLKEELSLLTKTEPRDGFKPQFIDLEYQDAEGNPVSLGSVVNDPQNRYVLLDFWATWCGPCVRSFPHLKELYAQYHGKGLEIYSVSLDSDKAKWKAFLEENDLGWIHVLDDRGGGRKSKLWDTYAVNLIPMLLLIDGNTGEILVRDNQPDLDAILAELL